MSSPNVELVRSIFADWEHGNFRVTSWASPQLEFVTVGGLTPGIRGGLDQAGRVWREFLVDWDEFRADAEEYREIDDERVLVLTDFSGRGKRSGAEVGLTRSKGATLFHVVDGRVTKLVLYPIREHALADLGLAPEGDKS